MNTIRMFCLLWILSVVIVTNCFGQYLYLDSALTISAPATYDNIRITSTGTLTADDSITVLGNMTIDSGGIVTQTGRQLNGIRLNISGILEVKSGGLIDVSGKGLLGGYQAGNAFGGSGEAFSSTGDTIKAGSGGGTYAAGGSYGGRGADALPALSNSPYGLLESPMHVGSGGGGNHWGGPGGNGGGRIRIIAGECILNGAIRSNGIDGTMSGGFPAGGGSGGSIWLTTGSLSGTGLIEANGGASGSYNVRGASGGGGRVAIFFDSMSLPAESISVCAGAGDCSHGSAGTIYLKDNAISFGNIIIDNASVSSDLYTPMRTSLTGFGTLQLRNRGQLHPVTADITSFNIDQPVPLTGSSVLWLGTGVTMTVSNNTGFDVQVQGASTILLDTNAMLIANAIWADSGTLTMRNTNLAFPVGTDLSLTCGGKVNVLNGGMLSVGVLDTTNFQRGTLFISEGSRLDITSDHIYVGVGNTLIKDGSFGEADSIGSITVAGVVTHSVRCVPGLRLKVIGTLDIVSSGMIDVSGKGLLGGNQARNVFGLSGETFNSTGDTIMAGSGASIGSSYGGWGASAPPPVANTPYGLLEAPSQLGSGGGGSGRGGVGGNGGGRIKVIAGECILNGAIRANGLDGIMGGGFPAGGGSGGGIWLTAGTLSGAGPIEANGGASSSYNARGGSGGGGRVAIFFDIMSLPTEKIFACAGAGDCWHGSAGTIYLKDDAQTLGTLIVDNANVSSDLYTPLRTSLTGFGTLQLRNRGQLHPFTVNITSFSVEQPVQLTSASVLWLGNGVTMTVTNSTGFDVQVQGASTFLLDSNAVLSANAVWVDSGTFTMRKTNLAFPVGTDLSLTHSGKVNVLNGGMLLVGVLDTTNFQRGTLFVSEGSRLDVASDHVYVGIGNTLIKDGTFGVADSIGSITVAGVVTHSVRYVPGLRLRVTGTLDIASGGMIDASGKGLLGGNQGGNAFGASGETFNSTGDTIKAGSGGGTYAAGGSYGGWSADALPSLSNSPYGLLEVPSHVGSGGGGNHWGGPGGNGGGRISVMAGECILNGAIRANGIDGTMSGGFPAGGGSGGGIWLTAGTLSGTGLIEANGGASGSYNVRGASGGGGRVAIFFDNMSLPPESISVCAGAGDCSHGSAGTIYLKDNAMSFGNVIIDNTNIVSDKYTPWKSALTRIQNLSVKNKAYFKVGPDVEIEGQLLISAGCKIGRP